MLSQPLFIAVVLVQGGVGVAVDFGVSVRVSVTAKMCCRRRSSDVRTFPFVV